MASGSRAGWTGSEVAARTRKMSSPRGWAMRIFMWAVMMQWLPQGRAQSQLQGLFAEYFTYSGTQTSGMPSFSGLTKLMNRIDSNVNFFDKPSWPSAGTAADPGTNPVAFLARWTGTIKITKAGNYLFRTESDDASMVYLNDSAIVNNAAATCHGKVTVTSSTIYLAAGSHSIRVEFVNCVPPETSNYFMVLSYQGPESSNVMTVIPSSVLTPTIPVGWTLFNGYNCYVNQGASGATSNTMTSSNIPLATCQSQCLAAAGCDSIVVSAGTTTGNVNCWLRYQTVITGCLTAQSTFNAYTYVAPPHTTTTSTTSTGTTTSPTVTTTSSTRTGTTTSSTVTTTTTTVTSTSSTVTVTSTSSTITVTRTSSTATVTTTTSSSVTATTTTSTVTGTTTTVTVTTTSSTATVTTTSSTVTVTTTTVTVTTTTITGTTTSSTVTVTTTTVTVTTTTVTGTTTSSTVTGTSSTVTTTSSTTTTVTLTSTTSTVSTTSSTVTVTTTSSTVTLTTTSSTVTVTTTTVTVTTTTGTETSTSSTVTVTTTTSSSSVTATTTTSTETGTTTTVTVTVTTTSSTSTVTTTSSTVTVTTTTVTVTTTTVTGSTMSSTVTGTTTTVTTTVTGTTTSSTVTMTTTTATVTATTVTGTTTSSTVTVTTTTVTVTATTLTGTTPSSTVRVTTTTVTVTTTTLRVTERTSAVTATVTTTSSSVTGITTSSTGTVTSTTSVTTAAPAAATAAAATSVETAMVLCGGVPAVSYQVPSGLLPPGEALQAFVFATSDALCLDTSVVNISLVDIVDKAAAENPVMIVARYDNSTGASGLPQAAPRGQQVFWLSISTGTTRRGRSYRLKVSGTGASKWSYFSGVMQINGGPVNGQVSVFPTTGQAVQTEFNITTVWQADPAILPLAYCFYKRPANASNNVSWAVLSAWSSSNSRGLLLSAQQWQVMVQARDILGVDGASPALSDPVLVTATSLNMSAALQLLAVNDTEKLSTVQTVAESAGESAFRLSPKLTGTLLRSLVRVPFSSKEQAVQGVQILQTAAAGVQGNSSMVEQATAILAAVVSSLSQANQTQGLKPEEAQSFAMVLSTLQQSVPSDRSDLSRSLAAAAQAVSVLMTNNLLSSSDCLTYSNSSTVSVSAPGLVLSAARVPIGKAASKVSGLPVTSIPQSVMGLAQASAGQDRCGQVVGAAGASHSTNPYGPLMLANGTGISSLNPLGAVVSLKMVDSKRKELVVQDLEVPITMVLPTRNTFMDKAAYAAFEQSLFAGNAPECRWWDSKAKTWSTEGCKLKAMTAGGTTMECSCVHLTDFGAFPSPGSIALNVGTDFLSGFFEDFVNSILCAKVQVLDYAGVIRMQGPEWQQRASTIGFWILIFLAIFGVVITAAMDLLHFSKDVSEEFAHLVPEGPPRQRLGVVPGVKKALHTAWQLVVFFCTRNPRWRKQLRDNVVTVVVAWKSGVCKSTLSMLMDKQVEGALPEEELIKFQKVLAKPHSWEPDFLTLHDEVKDELRKKFFLSRASAIMWAKHPVQQMLCSSVYTYHFARTLSFLVEIIGAVAFSAMFNSVGTVTYDSPETCVPHRSITDISGTVIQSAAAGLVANVMKRILKLLGAQRQLGPLRSRCRFIFRVLFSFMMPMALVVFFIFYICAFLANVYPDQGTEWIITGLTVVCFVNIFLAPFVTSCVFSALFDWVGGPVEVDGKTTDFVRKMEAGGTRTGQGAGEMSWRGVVPASPKQSATSPSHAEFLPGAVPEEETVEEVTEQSTDSSFPLQEQRINEGLGATQ